LRGPPPRQHLSRQWRSTSEPCFPARHFPHLPRRHGLCNECMSANRSPLSIFPARIVMRAPAPLAVRGPTLGSTRESAVASVTFPRRAARVVCSPPDRPRRTSARQNPRGFIVDPDNSLGIPPRSGVAWCFCPSCWRGGVPDAEPKLQPGKAVGVAAKRRTSRYIGKGFRWPRSALASPWIMARQELRLAGAWERAVTVAMIFPLDPSCDRSRSSGLRANGWVLPSLYAPR
jgi:hypothetical protein